MGPKIGGSVGGELAAPPGFEPGLSAPKDDVLPLHHGAMVLDSIVRRRAAIVKTAPEDATPTTQSETPPASRDARMCGVGGRVV